MRELTREDVNLVSGGVIRRSGTANNTMDSSTIFGFAGSYSATIVGAAVGTVVRGPAGTVAGAAVGYALSQVIIVAYDLANE